MMRGLDVAYEVVILKNIAAKSVYCIINRIRWSDGGRRHNAMATGWLA
jgi:hypothetical protein